MRWIYSRSFSSPSVSIACGVLATGNSCRVAALTLTSVACAESSTATSSSNGVRYSSSVAGCGFAACRRRKILRHFVAFMEYLSADEEIDALFLGWRDIGTHQSVSLGAARFDPGNLRLLLRSQLPGILRLDGSGLRPGTLQRSLNEGLCISLRCGN